MSDKCETCGKPRCECVNNADNHRSSNWCHGHADAVPISKSMAKRIAAQRGEPMPGAPVDLARLIDRIETRVYESRSTPAERDEIVLALRVLRVLLDPQVVLVSAVKDLFRVKLVANMTVEDATLDAAERILFGGGER